ncbi:hypothetical protein [Salipaludibacillus keqinensis]|uniref:hypothetical protein n=1 Tax=Salipaludibacillus keqinensis TaxID=2045207 RepID=UPI001304E8AA|nr:hypothetical protein [Salipaludibacillus keqinensis]
MTMLYLITWMGNAKKVTNDLEILIQRKPTSFKEFVLEHHPEWMKRIPVQKEAK